MAVELFKLGGQNLEQKKTLIKWNNSKIIGLPVTNVGSSTGDMLGLRAV